MTSVDLRLVARSQSATTPLSRTSTTFRPSLENFTARTLCSSLRYRRELPTGGESESRDPRKRRPTPASIRPAKKKTHDSLIAVVGCRSIPDPRRWSDPRASRRPRDTMRPRSIHQGRNRERDEPVVTRQVGFGFSRSDVPESNAGIVASTGQGLAVGRKGRHLTRPECPLNVARFLPVDTSQSETDDSPCPAAKFEPSSENARQTTLPRRSLERSLLNVLFYLPQDHGTIFSSVCNNRPLGENATVQ